MTPFERWSVWLTSTLTGITGVVLGIMKYLLVTDDPWAVVNHPLQPLMLKLHIVSAPLLVFAIGAITFRHVWRHFLGGLPRGRRSGVTTAIVVAPMILTGYLIQVFTNQGWLVALAIAHVGGGCVYLGGLAVHQLVVQRQSTARDPAAAPDTAREVGEAAT